MDDDNQYYSLSQEVFELKEQYLLLNQELETIKQLLQQRLIFPKQLLLFVKLLIVILLGINAQHGSFQFNGEQVLPMVETLTRNQEDI